MKYVLLLSAVFLVAATISDREIRWSNRPLSWDDFKQVSRNGTSFKAQTYSGIRYSLKDNNGKVYIDVEAYFDQEESWVVRGSNTGYLLNHEQLHFDITELFARKLRAELMDYQGMSASDFRSNRTWRVANEAHDRLYNEMVAMQNLYDEETDHSLRKKEQAYWESKIVNELDQLIEFSSP